MSRHRADLSTVHSRAINRIPHRVSLSVENLIGQGDSAHSGKSPSAAHQDARARGARRRIEHRAPGRFRSCLWLSHKSALTAVRCLILQHLADEPTFAGFDSAHSRGVGTTSASALGISPTPSTYATASRGSSRARASPRAIASERLRDRSVSRWRPAPSASRPGTTSHRRCASEWPRALYCTFPATGASSGRPWPAAVATRGAATSSPAAAGSTSGGIIGPSPDGSAIPSSSHV